MAEQRSIQQAFLSQPITEGAGVHLKRAFGHMEVPLFDPFLLFDDFRSNDPDHYIKGFPWHPHRGIETITYVLAGDVEHGDSLGNRGIISSGDVQWMTAGSGVIHQEMPKGTPDGKMLGFQLWANLPAASKMMPPRYQGITAAEIPDVEIDEGVKIKVICGQVNGVNGPVQDIIIDPTYLDVNVPANVTYKQTTQAGHTVLVYVIDGQGTFSKDSSASYGNETLFLFSDGEEVSITADNRGVRFLLISGKPIGEPVAWRGPIVMNTQQELDLAFKEYQDGTFIKDH